MNLDQRLTPLAMHPTCRLAKLQSFTFAYEHLPCYKWGKIQPLTTTMIVNDLFYIINDDDDDDDDDDDNDD